jgi:hypothetical protein
MMQDLFEGGKIESGELLIEQSTHDRYVSTSLFSRWSAHE